MLYFYYVLFYRILVNAFYFHKYLYTLKVIKCDWM